MAVSMEMDRSIPDEALLGTDESISFVELGVGLAAITTVAALAATGIAIAVRKTGKWLTN